MYENPKLKDLLFTSAVPCWKSAGELCSCSSESCNPHLSIFFMFLNTCWSFNQSLCSVPWGRNLSHPVWQGALILLNASNKIHTGAAKVSEKGGNPLQKKRTMVLLSSNSRGKLKLLQLPRGWRKLCKTLAFGSGADKGC